MAELTRRQSQIIDASLQLIAERGVEKLTYRNLAASLGISEPAFYRHFAGKSDILRAILEHFDGLRRRLFAEARSQSRDSLRCIQALFRGHLQLFQERPALAVVLFPEEIRQGRRELQAKVLELMRFAQEQIGEIVDEGRRRGEVRGDVDPQQAALIVSGALRLVVTRWRLEGCTGDLPAQGRGLARALVGLLGVGAHARVAQRSRRRHTDAG